MTRFRKNLGRFGGGLPVWALVVLAIIFAALLATSLGAGASTLFQSPVSPISPIGPTPTDTPYLSPVPTVLTTPTVIIIVPTPFSTPGEQPPPLPTAEGQPTVPPPPPIGGQVTATAPAVTPPTGATPVPMPTAAPQPTGGGPAPIVWIVVGLVLVALVVIIALSPKKPKDGS